MNKPADDKRERRQWRRIAATVDIPPGSLVEANEDDRVLWRTQTGTVVACESRCPHLFSHFAVDGYVADEHLVCAAHGWRFAPDGTATDRNGEPVRPLRIWPTRDDGEHVKVFDTEPSD